MIKGFMKVSIANGDQHSPRRPQSPMAHTNHKDLKEMRVGEYIIKAQKIEEESIDGYTLIIYSNNIIFEGEMIRSKKNGFGIEYNQKGSIIYEGYFRDDKYDGWGRTSMYTGQFRDGLYDGYGIYSIEHYYYQGFFQKAQQSGEGVCFKGQEMIKFHPVKNIYDFLGKGLQDNMSILEQYKIDQIYLGEWKQGVKHGFGRLWKTNYWYAGQFSNDLPHGLGAQEIKTSKDSKTESKVVQTTYKLGVKK